MTPTHTRTHAHTHTHIQTRTHTHTHTHTYTHTHTHTHVHARTQKRRSFRVLPFIKQNEETLTFSIYISRCLQITYGKLEPLEKATTIASTALPSPVCVRDGITTKEDWMTVAGR